MTETQTLSQRKRAAILSAAKQEFLAQGFSQTSMDQISERAGASKRTVYNHFSSKDALFTAITMDLLEQIHTAMQIRYDPARPLDEQLRQVAVNEIEVLTGSEFVGMFKVLLAESFASPDMAQQVLAEAQDQPSPVNVWIQAATNDGRLSVDDPDLAAGQFLSLLKGAFFWPVVTGYGDAPTGEAANSVIDGAIRMFLDHYET